MNRRSFVTGLGTLVGAGAAVKYADAAVLEKPIIPAEETKAVPEKLDPKYIIKAAHDILDAKLGHKASFVGIPKLYYEDLPTESRSGECLMISVGRYYNAHHMHGVDFLVPGMDLGLSNDAFINRHILPAMSVIGNALI